MSLGAAAAVAAASGTATRLGRRLLLIHYIGLLVGLLAVPWAVESSVHVPAKSVAALILVLLAYGGGQVAWWRALPLLDGLGAGATMPRPTFGTPQVGRLAAAVIVLVAFGVVLAERRTTNITCLRTTNECRVEQGGSRRSSRRFPIAAVTVSPGVPRSRLEVATEIGKETLVSVACAPRPGMVDHFGGCESRGARMLADMQTFLSRPVIGEVRIVDEDPWPSAALATILVALALWLLTTAFLEVRAPRMPYRPPGAVPPYRPRRTP
jgi:hypothetical protein